MAATPPSRLEARIYTCFTCGAEVAARHQCAAPLLVMTKLLSNRMVHFATSELSYVRHQLTKGGYRLTNTEQLSHHRYAEHYEREASHLRLIVGFIGAELQIITRSAK